MPLAGMAVVQTSQELATLPLAPLNAGTSTLSFPHFADGSGVISSIVLVNPSASKALQGTALLRDKTGASWTLILNGISYSGSVPFDIPPLGMQRLVSSGSGAVIVGSVQVTADGPIAGTAFFQASSGVAGVGSSDKATRIMFPVDTFADGGVSTGIAIMNPNSAAVTVTYGLRRQDGLVVPNGQRSISIPGRGQLAQFVEEIFAGKGIDFSNFKGGCEIVATGQVAAIALRSAPGQLATFPVAVVQ